MAKANQLYPTWSIPQIGEPCRPVSGEDNAIWSPTSSTLISGEHDAILVDALPSVREAESLADWTTSKGKTLTTVYLTDGHGDHHFGLGVILKRSPRARALASPDGLDRIYAAEETVGESMGCVGGR